MMSSRANELTYWPPGNFKRNFRHVIFKQILMIDGWGISCETALMWMSLDFTDDQSTLVQVMAWCRQATSHYLSQCWPRSLSPYGVTRPQWVNWLILKVPIPYICRPCTMSKRLTYVSYMAPLSRSPSSAQPLLACEGCNQTMILLFHRAASTRAITKSDFTGINDSQKTMC